MKIQNKKGFTLIELLVVITIMGILATAATATFTSQIQKARDATRTTDVNALKGGTEQFFTDMMVYPGRAPTIAALGTAQVNCSTPGVLNPKTSTSLQCLVVLGYVNKLPKDTKSGQGGNGSALEYTYNVGDKDGVESQTYEISHGVESNGSKTAKASNTVDSGNDDNRAEFGHPGANLNTCTTGTTACTGISTNVAIPPSTRTCAELNTTTGNVVIKGNCPAS